MVAPPEPFSKVTEAFRLTHVIFLGHLCLLAHEDLVYSAILAASQFLRIGHPSKSYLSRPFCGITLSKDPLETPAAHLSSIFPLSPREFELEYTMDHPYRRPGYCYLVGVLGSLRGTMLDLSRRVR